MSQSVQDNATVYKLVTDGVVNHYDPPLDTKGEKQTTVQLTFLISTKQTFDGDSGSFLAPTSIKVRRTRRGTRRGMRRGRRKREKEEGTMDGRRGMKRRGEIHPPF